MARLQTPYETTQVPVDKSQAQIRTLLNTHKVEVIRFTSFPAYALIEFGRRATKESPLIGYQLTITPRLGNFNTDPINAADKAERQVWRVAYWWFKSKFEALDFGLVEFEQEFLPYIMLNVGGKQSTVAQAFFENMAGRLRSPDNPFEGTRLMLPEGKENQGGSST